VIDWLNAFVVAHWFAILFSAVFARVAVFAIDLFLARAD
jgi:hypothetical protein